MGSPDWQVGVLRIAHSLTGGLLAFLGSYLLFPSWERKQLSVQLEKTIRANLAYFQIAIEGYIQGEDETSHSLIHLRHQAALENTNAEAAAQRLFSEPLHIRGEIEPVMTMVLYIRSLFTYVTTLTEHLRELKGERLVLIEPLTTALEQVLSNLADAIAQKQTLQPLPPLDDYLAPICDRIQQLHTARLSEIRTAPVTTTPTLQAVKAKTPVVTELNRIIRAVTIIHCTVGRIIEVKN